MKADRRCWRGKRANSGSAENDKMDIVPSPAALRPGRYDAAAAGDELIVIEEETERLEELVAAARGTRALRRA